MGDDLTTIILAVIAIFSSQGFWQYMQNRKSKKDGIESKLNSILDDVKKLKEAHSETVEYRKSREETDKMRDEFDLIIARNMLLTHYNECMRKGYYPIQDRDVYHELYENYHARGGDGVIDDIRPMILKLPTEKPK